ncbi:MAG TPA: PfaB family protein, partial [Anaerolineae bacterium]|nr:PfaB family protein [Anaerolineae bacterium]HQK14406.1 PfaB family protein [Anaerolineae bacterium]
HVYTRPENPLKSVQSVDNLDYGTAHLPGYWEWPGLPDGDLPAADPAPEPLCALGSVRTNLGDAAPALAALARTALCLYHRVIPATPDWRGPRDPQPDSPFYVAPAPQPWLIERAVNGEWRMANYESRTTNHESRTTNYRVLLFESSTTSAVPVLHAFMAARPFFMFPLAADDREAILTLTGELRRQAERGADLEMLAEETQATYAARPNARYALALLAHDREELLREAEFAVNGVKKAFAEGKDWTSPLGSSFTARPLGPTGSVAFVYPGAFSAYVGMGRDLFQLFPHLHTRLAEATRYVSRVTAEKLLYPRHLYPPTDADTQVDEAHLRANPTAMIEAGTSFAILYTAIMRDVFGVTPSAAFGYSLGEVSMLWALGVWSDGDAGSDTWNTSPLFRTRLCGPREAVREYWGLDATAAAPWCSYIVKAPVTQVRRALEAEPHAYLTIINEEKEVVIAGHPEACARVIAALDCHALPLPSDAAIHAPPLRSEYAAFVDLYTLPTRAVPGIAFYSAATYAPLTLERTALARVLAHMTCAPVDFPRLVHAVYEAGARIFVELGPLGTCSRWIDRILRDQPHAAIPINRSGKSDYDNLLPVLAMLVTQRVDMMQGARGRGQESANRQINKSTNLQIANQPINQSSIPNSLLPITHYTAEGHIAFLQARQVALQQTAALMALQMDVAGQMVREAGGRGQEAGGRGQEAAIADCESPIPDPHALPPNSHALIPHPPIFTGKHLRAFATGDVVETFGAAYARYRGRRMPRLPNGDLLCVSRILAIDGTPGVVEPGAALTSEFDVPANAWFYRDRAMLPLSILMETALQPCGVLSAYLGSILPYPESDFYFRNLDGEGELLRTVDVRGQTIVNRVTLLSSTALSGIILQKFSFELACAGKVFYRGTATFGYFTPEALRRQAGLDGGATRRPWLFSPTDLMDETDSHPLKSVQSVDIKKVGQLDLVDKVWCVPNGGEYGHGYVYAEIPITPDDWFFGCHFYQDPVMPGSLGVEAMAQAMQVYAHAQELGTGAWMPAAGQMTWKYRGQVPPMLQRLRLEVHIKESHRTSAGHLLIGDGSLWRGDLRIYEVREIGVGSTE